MDRKVNAEMAAKLGLYTGEFQMICDQLGRTPSYSELLVFSVMWSEEYAYKNAFHWLKTLPIRGNRVVNREQYPYQSYLEIEPNKGLCLEVNTSTPWMGLTPELAARAQVLDNIGGLLSRQATPLAFTNALGIGIKKGQSRHSNLRTIWEATSSPERAMGIPALQTTTFLHNSYRQNTLFNLTSIGLADLGAKKTLPSGSIVFYLPYPSGPQEASPSVTAMDPFFLKTGQDWMDRLKGQPIDLELQVVQAKGLVPALIELAQASGCGVQIDLDQLDKEEPAALGILQNGRGILLAVREPDRAGQLLNDWGVENLVIGKLTSLEEIKILFKGNERAHISFPLLFMGEGAPVYQREMKKPRNQDKGGRFKLNRVPDRGKYPEIGRELTGLPQLTALRAGRTHYDFSAGAIYLGESKPGDADLLDIPGLSNHISLTVSGNPEYLEADPFFGAMITVASGVRRTVCTGAQPLGIGLAVQFGNPYDPETYWTFMQAIRGVNEVCRRFKLPVLDQDVSFYNEGIGPGGAENISPLVTVTVLGEMAPGQEPIGLGFEYSEDVIYMLGTPHNDINASLYLRHFHGNHPCPGPSFDLDEEYHILDHLRKMYKKELLVSAHSLQEGGLFAGLIRAASVNNYGFDIETDPNFRKDAYLFGESQNRILITVRPKREDELVNYLNAQNVPFTRLGEVSSDEISIDGEDFGLINEWNNQLEPAFISG